MNRADPTRVVRDRKAGFTVAEMLVATALSLIVLAGVVSAMVMVMRTEWQQTIQMERLADAHRVASFLRSTIRLTNLGEMEVYPPEGPHTAVSYPQPGLPVASDGSLAWGTTVVVHGWPPDTPTELRLTRFTPRDTTLTAEDRAEQLEDVSLAGHGRDTYNGSNSNTRTLARITSSFDLRRDGRTYNFYAPETHLDSAAVLGGVHLLSGSNSIRFRTVGQAPESTGYGFVLDQFRISPAGLPLEAEALLPAVMQSGAVAVAAEQPAGTWSDKRALSFPATGTDAELVLNYFNDTWHETLFAGSGAVLDGTVTYLNTNSGSVGMRLRPEGQELVWAAMLQAGNGGEGATADIAAGRSVRVFMRGADAVGGNHILKESDGCTVLFRASDAPGTHLVILHAFIAEASNHVNPGPDIVQSTVTRIRFGSPSSPTDYAVVSSGDQVRSVPVQFPIDPEKSYAVTYYVLATPSETTGGYGYPWRWATAGEGTYTLASGWGSGAGLARTGGWSHRPDVVAETGLWGVAELRATYRDESVYVSPIVDTKLSAPLYHDLTWQGVFSNNTFVSFKVRTGQQPDLSDAPAWGAVSATTIPGTIMPGNGRYVQVRIALQRDPVFDFVPELRNFTLRWHGEPAYVDFGGVFQRMPSGGLVEILVNDEAPAAAFRAELTVRPRRNLSGFSADGWVVAVETSPRN